MKKNRGVLTLILTGIAVLACAVPGLPSASSPPTPDTRLERMVAETVSAALLLTQQAAPLPTEAPSATPIPTATNTPIPAVPTQSEETVLDKNSDGAVSFIDLGGRYQITVPGQWLALRVNSPEYDEAVLLPEASNPAIQRSLSTIKNQDANVFRLFMLDIAEEHIDGGFVTNINLVWDRQMEVSLASEDDLQALAAALPASLQDAEVTATELKATEKQIPYGVITARTPALTQEGAQIVVIQELVFLDLPTGTLTITLSTTETWQYTIGPSLNEIIESFIVLQ